MSKLGLSETSPPICSKGQLFSPSSSVPLQSIDSSGSLTHSTCSYCHNEGGFCHPFWIGDEILCYRCSEILPICAFCEKRTKSAKVITSMPKRTESEKNENHVPKNIHTEKSNGSFSSSKYILETVRDEDNQNSVMNLKDLHICRPCASLQRLRSDALPSLLFSTIQFLSRTTKMSLDVILPTIKVRLAGVEQIKLIASKRTMVGAIRNTKKEEVVSPATTFGVCVCNNLNMDQEMDESKPSKRLSQSPRNSSISSVDILLLRGLSLYLGGAFLSHELIHAVLYSLRQQGEHLSSCNLSFLSTFHSIPSFNSPSSFSQCDAFLYEEGLCHLAAAAWLTFLLETDQFHSLSYPDLESNDDGVINDDGHRRRQAEFWLKKFLYGSHPEFSIGFKIAKKVVEDIGWRGALDLLVKTNCESIT